MASDPSIKAPANRRADAEQASNSVHLLRSRGLRCVAGGEEDG